MIQRLLLISLSIGVALIGYELTRPNIDSIYADYKDSVVMLRHPNGSGGTGFAVKAPSGDEYILTNRHVCGDQKELLVTSAALPRPIVKKVIEVSKEHDLCLVEVPKGLKAQNIAPISLIGSKIYVVGYPRLLPITPRDGFIIDRSSLLLPAEYDENGECLPPFVEMQGWLGKVCLEPYDSIIITAEIHPGNSGSPLINRNGDVVGIVFAGNGVQGAAVPLEYIKRFLALY